MRPDHSFISQPIRSLQTMLQVIAQDDPAYLPLIPDGIYGPDTVKAVTIFQRNHGLPATGVADQDTWEAIVAIYEPALISQDHAHPLHIVLDPGRVIRKGERSPYVLLVQALLLTLSEAYDSVSEPGRGNLLDDATADSLASFQQLIGLPMTGHLDKLTWKHLALHYPLAVTLMEEQKKPL